MKKLLFLLSFALFIISCDKDSVDDPCDEAESFFDVSVNFSGDLLEIDEIPFSKGVESNDLCLVLVKKRLRSGGVGSSWYAHGLFDNMDDISISLSSLYTYDFKCFVIKGGKDIVYTKEEDDGSTIYYPIGLGADGNNGIVLNNEFVYSEVGFEDEAPSWETVCFYGGLNDIDPSTSSSLDFDMINISYKVRVAVDNINEGNVNVKIDRCVKDLTFFTGSEPENLTMSFPLSFSFDYDYFDEYPLSFSLDAYYNNGDKSFLIANSSIDVKRKRGYSITIRVPDDVVVDNSETKSLSVSFEDEDVDDWQDISL